MAGEYLRWKYRDVKPDEPPPPLTGWEKVKNWLYYHAIYLAAAAVVLAVAGTMIWNALGIGRTRPDYIFAYVGKNALPEDTVQALQRELAALGEDVNGDGETAVELRSYVSGGGDQETAAGFGAAAAVTLTADITRGESVFFITDDPAALQLRYQILAGPDGSLPAEDEYGWEGRALLWGDCPVLAALALGDYAQDMLNAQVTGDSGALMAQMYIGRRGFFDPEQEKNREANEKLWTILTKGAAGYP